MKRRIQLKSWLCVASLFSTLGFASFAQAAHSEPSTASPSSSGASSDRVNPSSEQIPTPLAKPIQLQLKPRLVFPPLHMPKSKYEEVRIWGLTIPTFVAYGLGGVSAGGAVLTGFAATRGNEPSNCVDSRCTEFGVRQRALWITTGVLTGMAVAGLSLGVTFMVKAKTSPSHDSIKPRLDLGLSGQKAEAKIGWVFNSF
jgi:hypothetical protein